MYSLTSLPSFPTDAPSAAQSRLQPFVDDGAIAAVVSRQQFGWQELRYIGEDFAGRDDCPELHTRVPALLTRQTCGAFFTPTPEKSVPLTNVVSAVSAPEIDASSATPLWSRSLAVASAAAILLAASLIGLWASHSFATQTSQDSIERKQQDAPMVSQMGER